MSRQNKQAHFYALRAEFTALHKKGEKGPSKTTPKHSKAKARRRYNDPDVIKARVAIVRASRGEKVDKPKAKNLLVST